jgi:hypothetical protein
MSHNILVDFFPDQSSWFFNVCHYLMGPVKDFLGETLILIQTGKVLVFHPLLSHEEKFHPP